MNTGVYDRIVFEFLDKTENVLLLVCEDPLFVKVLRMAINKTVGVKRDCVHVFSDLPAASKSIREYGARKVPAILLVERLVKGRPSTEFIVNVKNLFPDQKVIVLVSETRKENIAYFYELGVNNVIAKPASMNNVIEKLAFTIKPQGKLSELMDVGKDFLNKGDLKQVLKLAEKILALKPGSPAGLMLKGDAYLEMGRREDAIEAYLEAHKSSTLYLEPLKRLANVYKDHDQELYLEYLKKLDRLSPLHTERKCEIGKVHAGKGEFSTAEKYFDQAIDAATQEAMSIIGVIAENIANAVGDTSPELAEKYLAKMIESKGKNLTREDLIYFNRLGIALRRQGKWREAIANYEKAQSVAPDDEGLHYNIALAYLDGEKKREAMLALRKALEINPRFHLRSANVSFNLGKVFSECGDASAAVEYLENAVKLDPEHAEAVALLERCRTRSR